MVRVTTLIIAVLAVVLGAATAGYGGRTRDTLPDQQAPDSAEQTVVEPQPTPNSGLQNAPPAESTTVTPFDRPVGPPGSPRGPRAEERGRNTVREVWIPGEASDPSSPDPARSGRVFEVSETGGLTEHRGVF